MLGLFYNRIIIVIKQYKQVLVLYGSTIIGVILGIISSVINTRSLQPLDYGNVRYIQNLIAFISSLLLLGYFTSGSRLLALSKDELHSRKIRGAMVFIMGWTLAVLSIVMLGFFLYGLYVRDYVLTPLYFISIFTGGNVILLNYINTTAQGDNHIWKISLARLLPSLAYIILALIIYHYVHVTSSLMLLLYNGSAVVILAWIIHTTKPSFKNLKNSLSALQKENTQYGFQVYVGSVAGVSTSYIAGITLGAFCHDNTDVGFYTLALTLATPLSMLPTIIGTSYFRQFAKQGKISGKVLKASVLMSILSCVLFVMIVDLIVDILYDDTYSSVSTYASYLAIGTSVHGLGDMFNRFLGAHGQGKALRNSAFICGAVITIGSICLVYYFQIYGAIITKVAGSIAYFSSILCYYIKYTNK